MAAAPSNAITTGALAQRLRAELRGPAEIAVTGIDALEHAVPGQITFIRDPKFARQWAASRASAVIVSRGIDLPPGEQAGKAVLTVADTEAAVSAVLEMFLPAPHLPATGVHPTAVADPSALIDGTARIGPHVSIGPGTSVEAGAVLHAGVRLGANVRVGRGSVLGQGVAVLDRCVIGARCILHPNAVIGADGFGFRLDPAARAMVKVPHVGHVEIGDDVEIGACTTIDRGKFGATSIGSGTKIDNLVQIAHNVRIGRSAVICGCVGISGSVTIGNGAFIGGGAGFKDNITVGDGAQIAANAGVMSDVPAGEAFVGAPAKARQTWAREQIAIRRLGENPPKSER